MPLIGKVDSLKGRPKERPSLFCTFLFYYISEMSLKRNPLSVCTERGFCGAEGIVWGVLGWIRIEGLLVKSLIFNGGWILGI